jgi:hypothetical protein
MGDFMTDRLKSKSEHSTPPWELLLGASEESQRAREAWRAGRPLSEINAKARNSEKGVGQQTRATSSARNQDTKPSTTTAASSAAASNAAQRNEREVQRANTKAVSERTERPTAAGFPFKSVLVVAAPIPAWVVITATYGGYLKTLGVVLTGLAALGATAVAILFTYEPPLGKPPAEAKPSSSPYEIPAFLLRIAGVAFLPTMSCPL